MTTGLDGVVVARTVLSEVDGANGRLVVRGLPVEELAGRLPFEAVAQRLWDELAPVAMDEQETRAAIGEARAIAYERLSPLFAHAAKLPPIDGLRLGLSGLAGADHILVTAAIPVILAAAQRLAAGLAPVAPDPALGHAADFLRMCHGTAARPEAIAALDAYLATVSEHGMNASTFTARVIASTRAGVLPAVIGALSALEGPLHGGAPGPVLDMLDAIGATERIDGWLASELTAGRRLMGFGHRVYRVRDPRADVLRRALEKLAGTGNARLDFALEVERRALAALARHKPDRPLATNVEFYTALLLEAVGIERALFTPVFAMGRVAGWCAHVFEQEKTGRLLRPQSEYVGPVPA